MIAERHWSSRYDDYVITRRPMIYHIGFAVISRSSSVPQRGMYRDDRYFITKKQIELHPLSSEAQQERRWDSSFISNIPIFHPSSASAFISQHSTILSRLPFTSIQPSLHSGHPGTGRLLSGSGHRVSRAAGCIEMTGISSR